MTSSLQTGVTVFILRIKVLYKMKLKQLVQHKSKSPEVDKANESNMTKMKQDRRYLKIKAPGCCPFQQQVSWPSIIFTVILLLKFSGP